MSQVIQFQYTCTTHSNQSHVAYNFKNLVTSSEVNHASGQPQELSRH